MKKAIVLAPTTPKQQANSRVATVGMVKRILHKNLENKLAGTAYQVQFNAQIDSPGDAYGLLPSIANGSGDNTRVGNRITPRGLLVSLNVYMSTDAGSPPGTTLLPRILVMQQKSQTGFQPGLSVDFARLLDRGQGEHAFTGELVNYREPINTDSFHVYKDIKTKIGVGNGDENLSVISKTYKFWVPCPKTLLYADGQNYPQNFAPFICVGFARADGVVGNPGYLGITMDWSTTLYYEDA